MKITVLVLTCVLFLTNAVAQTTGRISGTVLQDARPAEGATISLLRAKDSSLVKLSIANNEGQYVFERIADGSYLIAVTAAGHLKKYSNTVDVNERQREFQVPAIGLVAGSNQLKNVTVTTRRALIEQRIDRTIVNVDASITNVGTSALEVLEKSPGVSVDRDGNITLKGKQGVLIMVDGRPTQLSGADLANLLRNMNTSQLDQIEIMTNPPARYDAAGNAGVINIKTKKILKAGMNGSASVAFGIGKYPKTNESFNFNYREGKVNLFANLGYNYQKRYSTLWIDRNIINPNTATVDNIFNQEATRVSAGNSYSAKVGIDFFATPRTTMGASANLNRRDLRSNNPSITNISNAFKVLESVTKAAVNNDADWNSGSVNLNFRRLLDKTGKEITSDIDYVKYSSGNNLFMVNSYTNATGDPSRKADTLTGALPQNIDIYSARVDYLHPTGKNRKFEAGIKSSIVRTDNNASYDSIQYGAVVHDFNRSNHFIYEENINAAYVNLSTPLSKKLAAQLGLRLENTRAKGIQKTTGEDFDRNYTQLFPTAYFQYKITDKHTLGANLGRRVSRPSYQSLNPFIRFIDRYTFEQGNPALKPSVSTNVELTHSWKNQITTTLNYTRVKDVIEEIIQQKGEETYNVPANVSSYSQFGIAVSASTPITKWWTSNINVNLFDDHYSVLLENSRIQRSATSFIINAIQQFKISKTLTAEINRRFRNGWLEGIMKTNPVGIVGAGISQQVLKNKGMIRFSVRDIFWTQRLKGVTQYANVDVRMRQVSESRVATLGFTYSFSKGKKIAPVKRTAGSAGEEQNRIGQ